MGKIEYTRGVEGWCWQDESGSKISGFVGNNVCGCNNNTIQHFHIHSQKH